MRNDFSSLILPPFCSLHSPLHRPFLSPLRSPKNMYKRGFLDKSENETKWNLNDKKQRWRMYATRCLRKIFDKDGLKGIETLFKTADLDGSGELDAGEVRDLFAKLDPEFPPDDLNYLMARLDSDRSGLISWAEFETTVCSGWAVVHEFVNQFHNTTTISQVNNDHDDDLVFVNKRRRSVLKPKGLGLGLSFKTVAALTRLKNQALSKTSSKSGMENERDKDTEAILQDGYSALEKNK